MNKNIFNLKKDLEGTQRDKAEKLKLRETLKGSTPSRKIMEEIQNVEEDLTRLGQLEIGLQKVLEKAEAKNVIIDYQQRIQEIGQKRKGCENELNEYVANASDAEREIFEKFGLGALKKTQTLLHKMAALAENQKYYVDELAILTRQLQRLSE